MELQRKTLIDGMVFGEAHRWHDGRLWFSDMHARAVMTADDFHREKVLEARSGKIEIVEVDLPGAGLP